MRRIDQKLNGCYVNGFSKNSATESNLIKQFMFGSYKHIFIYPFGNLLEFGEFSYSRMNAFHYKIFEYEVIEAYYRL